MSVRDILAAKGSAVETIRADATVPLALHRLASQRIGALVVSPDGEQVDGVVSEGDIVRALSHHGARLLDMTVRDVMVKGGPSCAPGDSVTAVMVAMTRTRRRHLPVVDGGRLVGIISVGDVVKRRLDDLELETAVLRETWIARR